jgi:glucose/arabinose dehydrogenase
VADAWKVGGVVEGRRAAWIAAQLFVAVVFVTGLAVAGCADDADRAVPAEPTASGAPTPTPQSTPPPSAGEPTAAPTATATPEPTATPSPSPTPLPPLQGLTAELVADGFDQPILVTGAPGTDALFVVEREGLVRVVEGGVIADEPFLDMTKVAWSWSIEQGLLGLAFHPDYASNGRFFAYWTEQDLDSQLGELEATTPTSADPDSRRVLLEIDQPAERHNAGMLLFGPDGLLYLSLGDGATGGRPSQDTTNLLGSILRLDVDSGDPYTIPPENPFGNEIWLQGLRNPWRFSIDPVDEMVYIGDVGQVTIEEVNVVPLAAEGANFGWPEMEGRTCQGSRDCETEGMTTPVASYTHNGGRCSITGGWVYRGSEIPELYGHYFYGDWCTGMVRSFRLDGAEAVEETDWSAQLKVGQVTSFGVDNQGELYTVNWEGQLHRIIPLR